MIDYRSVIAISAATIFAAAAHAQNVESFYKGKTIDVIVGFPPGAYNDVYSRLLASHMGKYIPGHPNFVIRNMPGGGSFVAVNHIYANAPRDGTVMGLGSPTLALDEALSTEGVRFKTGELGWIGRTNSNINVLATWKNSKVRTIADALQFEATLSGTGIGSTTAIYPIALNNVIGTKFKMVMGYKGSGEGMMAMERGETDGHNTSWTTFYGMHPDWFDEKKLNVIVQFALSRNPRLKDVPTALELAKDDEQRAVLRAVLLATEVGYAFFTSPGVPPARLKALRDAFAKAVKDPEFLAEAKKMNADIDPLSGEDLQRQISDLGSASPAIIAKVKVALQPK
jgi:tripartite-type tricarboxylate transporter receptor subunit TctC